MDEAVLMKAQFDPKVKLYWYVQGLIVHFTLVFAIIGCVTLPFWMVFGFFFVGKRFDAISAQLTSRSVHLKHGVLNQVEKTVPLEKIQDLSLRTGPLLKAMGLASIQIETAGSSVQGGADMALPGLANAQEFRDAVLKQREALSDGGGRAPAPQATDSDTAALLTEIRDSLKRIEVSLRKE